MTSAWRSDAVRQDWGRNIAVYIGRDIDTGVCQVAHAESGTLVVRTVPAETSMDPAIVLPWEIAEALRDALVRLLPLPEDKIPAKVESLYREMLEKERSRVDGLIASL